MAIEFIKTGIEGLDKVLKGGLRRNSSILVTGAPGTGKSILALQFVYNGAKEQNENGMYISTEEDVLQLRDYAANLGMDLKAMEEKKKPLSTMKGGLSSIKGLLDFIKKYKIRRVALDSMIFFEYLYPKYNSHLMEYRRQILIFVSQMKEAGVTFLAASERKITDLDRLEYDMIDFIFTNPRLQGSMQAFWGFLEATGQNAKMGQLLERF